MNTLWLTKKTLTNSSTKEANRWGLELLPVTGTGPDKKATLNLLKSIESSAKHISVITNYETTNTNLSDLMQFKWDVFVIDEVHKLKGGGRPTPPLLWTNTDKLLKANPNAFKQFLSGTPMQNKPEDMFAYLALFSPDKFVEPFGSHSEAIRNFLYVFANRNFAEKYNLNTAKLFDLLSANIIRRRKDEVGIQLPSKTYVDYEIPIEEDTALYEKHRSLYNDMILSLPDDTEMTLGSMFAYFHYLRAILIAPGKLKYNYYPVDPITLERSDVPIEKHLEFDGPFPKLQAVFEKACDLLDEDEQVVITSAQYNTPLKWLQDMFESMMCPVETLDGSTSYMADKIEERFQQGETKVLLLNSKAGAEGLNLQRSDNWPGGASHLLMIDQWWNPGVNEQVEDRLWRTGTKYPVTIHRFFVEKSVDQLILEILDDKKQLNDEIMESERLRPKAWKERLARIFGD